MHIIIAIHSKLESRLLADWRFQKRCGKRFRKKKGTGVVDADIVFYHSIDRKGIVFVIIDRNGIVYVIIDNNGSIAMNLMV